MNAEKDFPYWDQRLENDAFLARMRWYWRRYLAGTLKSQVELHRLRLATEAENLVAGQVRALGYEAHLTTPNCPFDLWVADSQGRTARVEVKLSFYHPNKGGGRYQADVRQGSGCDLLIWICRNGRDWTYVIPIADLAARRNLAIWSYCPGNYTGQWHSYLGAWDHLHQVVASARGDVRQLSLAGGHS